MAFNKSFFYCFLILGAVALISLTMFPLSVPTTEKTYNYLTKQDEYRTKDDITSILIIMGTSIALMIWLATSTITDTVLLRNGTEILYDTASSSVLSRHSIIPPFKITYETLLGESHLGWIKAMKVLNKYNTPIFIIFVANENYRTTESRPKLTSPVIADTSEYLEIKSTIETLKPSMRGSFETRYKSIMRELEEQPEEIRRLAAEKMSKESEEDENV